MSEIDNTRIERGVDRLADETEPLGERVQRLIDDADMPDGHVGRAIVEYGRRLRNGEASEPTERRLQALVRLARRHDLDVTMADFGDGAEFDGGERQAVEQPRSVVVDSIAAAGGCIAAGEEITVTATLLNLEDRKRTHTVPVTVGDHRVHETDIVLGAGGSGTVSFTLEFGDTGEYVVGVGAVETVQIEVLEPSAGVVEPTGSRQRANGDTPPVTIRSTSVSDAAPEPTVDPVTIPGASDGDTAPLELPAESRPVTSERCEFPFADDGVASPEGIDPAGIVVVDDVYFGVVRVDTDGTFGGTERPRRSLSSFVRPYLSGLDFPTRVVGLPPEALVRPRSAGVDAADGEVPEHIETALSEYSEAVGETNDGTRAAEWEQFVVTQLGPSHTAGSDGTGVVSRLADRATGGILQGSDGDSERGRTACLRELDDRLGTIHQVLQPLELSWDPVESERIAVRAIARSIEDRRPARGATQ
jgi:uncharacterized protein YndB with AHSA1/START domain